MQRLLEKCAVTLGVVGGAALAAANLLVRPKPLTLPLALGVEAVASAALVRAPVLPAPPFLSPSGGAPQVPAPIWMTGARVNEPPELSSSDLHPRWSLPGETLRAGERMHVPYELPNAGGPPLCSEGLKVVAMNVRNALMFEFRARITKIEGWVCRENTASKGRLSLHAVGRALDVFVVGTGDLRQKNGDMMANWLVEHAESLKIQLVIWNRTQWRANGHNDVLYRGPSPHEEHLHVEVSERPLGSFVEEPGEPTSDDSE